MQVDTAGLSRPAHLERPTPGIWSLDLRVMLRPADTLRALALAPGPPVGMTTVVRRPLFIAFVLACTVSVVATGVATLRVVAPAIVYWSFVPVVEVLALLAIVRSRVRPGSLAATIDLFFAGHGPWTLLLVALGAVMGSLPPQLGWVVLTTVAVGATVFVLAWSAYIDFCFFRIALGATRRVACRDLLLNRLLTWTAVFVIFAVPVLFPWAIVEEILEVYKELT